MIILSALVAHVGWQWMQERGGVLLNSPWPQPSLANLATVALWTAGILFGVVGLRAIFRRLRARLDVPAPRAQEESAAE